MSDSPLDEDYTIDQLEDWLMYLLSDAAYRNERLRFNLSIQNIEKVEGELRGFVMKIEAKIPQPQLGSGCKDQNTVVTTSLGPPLHRLTQLTRTPRCIGSQPGPGSGTERTNPCLEGWGYVSLESEKEDHNEV